METVIRMYIATNHRANFQIYPWIVEIRIGKAQHQRVYMVCMFVMDLARKIPIASTISHDDEIPHTLLCSSL